MKRPFSRQHITSSGSQQFVDTSLTNKAFGGGDDLGILVMSDSKKAPLEYGVGIFNGTGSKSALGGDVVVDLATGEGSITGGGLSNVPDRFNPMLVARLGWHTAGFDGYSEADPAQGEFGFGVGGSFLADFDADQGGDANLRGEIDFIVKAKGFSTTGGLYVKSAQSGTVATGQDFHSAGFHLQAGYAVLGKVEPIFRYARVFPDGADNDLQEILGGLNVFFFGHNLKWQTDAGVLTEEAPGDDTVDFRIRTQLQLAF